MKVPTRLVTLTLLLVLAAMPSAAPQAPATAPRPDPADARLAALKQQAMAEVDGMQALTQQMIDQVFSFGELGFQEVETSRYLTGVLRKNGFTVTEGVAGIPTAWFATWGSGKPVIALGSDIDGLPQTSQKPGVPRHEPLVEGAPGHGEGHNSGVPMNITAALAVKRIMEREKLGGTIIVWPGVAEELVAAKAFYVRDGLFKDVDVVLFSHVASSMGVSWGAAAGNGLVSVEYAFKGQSAHSAGIAVARPVSALDAVELMNVGWNFRREHLRLQQRSHYVITDGGDQPNVVPPTASVWYYFRETDYPRIKEMWDIGNRMAEAAAMMTDTTVTSRVLGAAWPQHFNKVVAEDDVRQHPGGRHAEVGRCRPGAGEGRAAGAEAERARARVRSGPARPAGPRRRQARRRLGRHRRRVVGRADHHAALPGQHPRHHRAPLVERHRHGHADRPQGVHGRREGARADHARPPAQAGAREAGVGVLHDRADEGPEVHAAGPAGGQAGDVPQREDHGARTARR